MSTKKRYSIKKTLISDVFTQNTSVSTNATVPHKKYAENHHPIHIYSYTINHFESSDLLN